MKKYFVYELKKNGFVIGCLSLIATILYVVSLLTADISELSSSSDILLWVTSYIGGFLAVGVPVWIFSYKMKKRSVDLYFSLPLTHAKIFATKYLLGLIIVFLPYTVSYWLGAFTVMAKNFEILKEVWYIPHFLASLIPVYIIYSISTFVFTRANRMVDGVIFILFWALAAALIALLLNRLTSWTEMVGSNPYARYHEYVNIWYYFPVSPIVIVTNYFQYHLFGRNNLDGLPETVELVNMILGFLITSLLSVGSTVGVFLFEKRAKAENVEQISQSVFGYKVMIPLFTVCLLGSLEVDSSSYIIFILMIAVASFLLTSIYKRSMKIGKKQLIIYCVSVAVGVLLSVICSLY